MKTHPADGPRRRVVIYCRISSDPEGLRAGVERQERECRRRAEKLGWDVVAVLVENDLSAYSGKPRPQYELMLSMLRLGEADAVLALSPKRLYRQLKDALDFFDLIAERNTEVVTLKQGRYDLSTAEGRRDARRAAVDAQYESEEIGERVRDAKADAAAKGLYRGGPRPFGYEADGTTPRTLICPKCDGSEGFDIDRTCNACGTPALNAPGTEAWHTEHASKAIVAGDSLRSIQRSWAAAGVRTVPRRYRQADGTKGEPEDREWQAEEIRKLLLRPRNAGLLEVSAIGPDGKRKPEIVGRAAWAPIVDEDTWRACKAVLQNPARRTTTSNSRVWLLSGLARCWCGAGIRGSSSGVGGIKKALEDGKTHRPAYRCSASASHVVRDAPNFDKFIERNAVVRLSRPDAAGLLLPPQPTGDSHEDLAATANALRAKLSGYTQDYDADLITRQQMLDGTALTRKRLEKVEAQMAARTTNSVLAGLPLGTPEAGEQWKDYDLDKKRAIIDALMTITVHRARRGRLPGFKPGTGQTYFDESTIDIDWKKVT